MARPLPGPGRVEYTAAGTLPGEHPCQDLAPGTQPFQSPFLSSVPALHLYQRSLVPGSPVALLVRPGPRLCQPPVRPCSHPCLRPLGPRRCRPGAPRGPRRGRLHPVPERAPRPGARRLRPSLLPGVRGAILGGGRRALSVSRVCRRLLAARRGARPPAAQPPPAGARRSSCGAHARRPGLRGGAAAAVPRRRGPAVRSLPHGRGARATRVGAPLEEGAARQGALSRRVPCPCSHHQTAPCPPSVFSGWRPGPQSPSSGRCPGCPPHTPVSALSPFLPLVPSTLSPIPGRDHFPRSLTPEVAVTALPYLEGILSPFPTPGRGTFSSSPSTSLPPHPPPYARDFPRVELPCPAPLGKESPAEAPPRPAPFVSLPCPAPWHDVILW